MKNAIIIFLVFGLIGFGGGYLFNQSKAPGEVAAPEPSETTETPESSEKPAAPADVPEPEPVASIPEAEIFTEKGCLTCHSVGNLGLEGGATGPDLSNAYENVEGKHGVAIEEFLKAPTSAVMSGVISGNPLSDEEISQIVTALKIASEN